MDKQHEDELSVSVAEKIGSRRKEKSEERKGAKRSEKERKCPTVDVQSVVP